MKISKSFKRDYEWYLSVSDIFTFDGVDIHRNKKGDKIVNYQTEEKGGYSARVCFYCYDTQGKIIPTYEPEKLTLLLKTKGSVNLHIKMYAQDRASGILPKWELQELCEKWNAPEWFFEAIENQKKRYWK